MDYFQYRNGQLFAEEVNLNDLAEKVGTPLYVYSRRTIEEHYTRLSIAFAPLQPLICFSVKSCSNIHILKLLVDRGAGMDVVSGGELYRALAAGAAPERIVFAGVGKTDAEIRQALEARIGLFNIESEAEFENIAAIARRLGRRTCAAVRINPDVDPRTHPKTATGKAQTKFGLDLEAARRFFARYGRDPYVRLQGLHLHIGSPVYAIKPYIQAATRALKLVETLEQSGLKIQTLDLGGGFGADYQTDQTPDYAEYAASLVPLLSDFVQRGGRLIFEPGRTIVANAGLLLTRVQYVKITGRKKFVIVDAGMNDLIRPALYGAFHFIWPTRVAPMHQPRRRSRRLRLPALEKADVVGPVCETGDSFVVDWPLPPVARGDLLAIFSAGAYGMAMASNYNARPRPAEVLVDGSRALLIRRRETYDDLVAPERRPRPL